MNTFNVYLFNLINQGSTRYVALDWFFIFFTKFYLYIIGIGIVYYLFFYLPRCESEFKGKMRRYAQAGEVLLGVLLSYASSIIIKVLIIAPRPFIALSDIRPLITAAPFQSFPSGHATLAMAIATSVYFYHKRLGTYLFAFAFVTGLSRIYVGVHYPIDVVVGLLLGFAIPTLIYLVFSDRQSRLAQIPKNG